MNAWTELKVNILFHMFDINLRLKPSECMNMWGTSQDIFKKKKINNLWKTFKHIKRAQQPISIFWSKLTSRWYEKQA